MFSRNVRFVRDLGLFRAILCLLTLTCLTTPSWADSESEPKIKKSVRPARLLTQVRTLDTTSMVFKFSEGATNTQPGLVGRYRMALEKESRRRLDKDPAGLFLLQTDDEDGNPVQRSRREAKKIFGGATGRLLSEFVEVIVEDAVALQTAKDYIQGIRLDVMAGGDMRFQAGQDDTPYRAQDDSPRSARDAKVAASFGLIAIGHPRIEMRTTLPGDIRTRVEVPLTEAGIRATFSRRLNSHLRGTLSAGVEDSGADKWATLGLGIKF